MEPFVVSAMRQLSSAHPVYKLLKPYFRYRLTRRPPRLQTAQTLLQVGSHAAHPVYKLLKPYFR